jgi:2-C-methyl-D-erythritol 4-phosphate cytidylyltransferase/2-C-methyl-D-erythritol 2,4-cyclodiphosphate synthase
MGGLDKQLASIAGRPLLAWTLDAIVAAPAVDAVVVVAAADRRDELAAAPWLPRTVVSVVAGGERRQDSVRAGFAALEALRPDPSGQRVVLVHDGARPAVSPALVARVAEAADRYGAAIPVVPIVETVKRVADGLVTTTVDRSELAVAQTPQGIRRAVFRDAIATVAVRPDAVWTDEAAILEACRIAVHVVDGEPENRKVTVPADLARVAAHLTDGPERRTGIGQDSHPFGPGSPLRLGGLEFPDVPRLHGHSDGDVALHAVADALLGAAGLGDLGRLAPADERTPAGIASTTLLVDVLGRLAEAGWRPSQVDLTIVAARPRLGSRLDEIAGSLAGLLRLAPAQINVKASSGNLTGDEGAGRSISALAVTSIERVR